MLVRLLEGTITPSLYMELLSNTVINIDESSLSQELLRLFIPSWKVMPLTLRSDYAMQIDFEEKSATIPSQRNSLG